MRELARPLPVQNTLSARGNPSAAIRFSMLHLMMASTCWLSNLRDASFGPNTALNLETAFS
ncbi:MAG: hypothetical protein OEQ39_27295, partial [Gammaproteobacteria bacterium]|nr:hypothetical protein [Gammaproteobacteria bacterium]